ncbi:hypothetical protein ACUY1T_21940 [Billgrantia sp. Q4P2]|uniref:hypothetical protein n=1 Tax=Billgrantia sp. Q4P2 TaxID=3463857 RepID=UPI004056A10E
MKIRDPLSNWSQPEAVTLWGEAVSPPPQDAWLDYVNYYVHPDVVAVVGRLLVPAFVEHEGGVFLRNRFTLSGYASWKAELGEISAVEKMINHQHVYDLFSTDDEITEASFENVANLMAQTLRLALCGSFSDRHFHVYVSNTDQDYGPVVGFHSVGTSSSDI